MYWVLDGKCRPLTYPNTTHLQEKSERHFQGDLRTSEYRLQVEDRPFLSSNGILSTTKSQLASQMRLIGTKRQILQMKTTSLTDFLRRGKFLLIVGCNRWPQWVNKVREGGRVRSSVVGGGWGSRFLFNRVDFLFLFSLSSKYFNSTRTDSNEISSVVVKSLLLQINK